MFCPKCGAQNPENSPFCAGCGSPLEAPQPPAPEPTAPAAPADGKKKKMFAIITGCAALILVIVVLALTLSGRSYKKTVKMYCDIFSSGKASTIIKLIPKEGLEAMLDRLDMDMDDLKDDLKDKEEDYKDMLKDADEDEIPKISYRIKDTDTLKKSRFKDLQEEMEDSFDIEISDALEVEVEFTFEFEDEDDNHESDEDLLLIKIGRSWYLSPSSLFDIL